MSCVPHHLVKSLSLNGPLRIVLPSDVFGHECPDEVVREEDSQGDGDDGDDGALDDSVQVSGGDVDEDVSPGQRQGHDGVQQRQDQDQHGVVLTLSRHQHPAHVVAEEVTYS